MIKISERLESIADKVPAGSRLADIGSDHALLPVYLALRGQIERAVAGEVHAGPYESAKRQIEQYGLEARIEARFGDGLEVVRPAETDVIVIAGMGGGTIVDILTAGRAKLDGVRKMILQPNIGEERVRRWIVENDWFLANESILEEDGKIYEILEAESAPDARSRNRLLFDAVRLCGGLQVSADRLFQLGPYLLHRPQPVFIAKWEAETARMERTAAQLERSALPASRQRRIELIRELGEIREVLKCLQKDRR